MRIAVCIKQTPDTEARIRLMRGGQGIEEDGLTWIISPHDESAIEQALLLKEKHGGDVTAIALGPDRVEPALRTALAMGVDSALHLACNMMPIDAKVVADALVCALRSQAYDLVLTGEHAIDQEGAQVPQRLAIALGWPCVTAVEAITLDGGTVQVQRPVEQTEETVWFALPGVVGINRRAGEPRYPSFRNIMKAKRKKIARTSVELGKSTMHVERLYQPPAKESGNIQTFGSGIEDVVAQFLAGKVDA